LATSRQRARAKGIDVQSGLHERLLRELKAKGRNGGRELADDAGERMAAEEATALARMAAQGPKL
jgi:hypothetical protein